MRILGGKFKGKNIIVPSGIRPVSVRVKKSCFDILRSEIEGKKVLDLFSGSGSLGIEAFSLGAGGLTFVDSEKKCIIAIKKNILSLNIGSQANVYLKDSLAAVKDFFVYKESFDIVFLDPPYYKGMLTKTLQVMGEYDIVAPLGYIVAFCYLKDDFIEENSNFSLIVNRKHGQTLLLIYRKNKFGR